MKRAWMPLYVGDYLGDTGHLTTTQHGAYLLLLMHYWRKGELPDDDKQLAAITKLPLRLWMDSRETLQAFFFDGWKHKRMEAEIAKMEQVSNKRAAAGRTGGLKSALGRMHLENVASGRAKQTSSKSKQLLGSAQTDEASNCYNFAAARLDHSHSQRIERGKDPPVDRVDNSEEVIEGSSGKPPHAVTSAELATIYAMKAKAH